MKMWLLTLLFCVLAVPGLAQEGGQLRSALLIIDIQEFYFPGGALPLVEPAPAARNAGRVLQEFRKAGDLVVHVGHNAGQGAAFHPEVTPEPGEKVFMKDEVNAFVGTGLLEFLRESKVTDLVVCGMQTHMCLEGAVRAARDYGFSCVVIEDACATRDLKFNGESVSARQVHLATLKTLQGAYAQVLNTEAWLQRH
jgi:nicotinamidase-related amidase